MKMLRRKERRPLSFVCPLSGWFKYEIRKALRKAVLVKLYKRNPWQALKMELNMTTLRRYLEIKKSWKKSKGGLEKSSNDIWFQATALRIRTLENYGNNKDNQCRLNKEIGGMRCMHAGKKHWYWWNTIACNKIMPLKPKLQALTIQRQHLGTKGYLANVFLDTRNSKNGKQTYPTSIMLNRIHPCPRRQTWQQMAQA